MASRKKPAVLYIVAVLNLMLGATCFCCMSCAGVGTIAGDAMQPQQGAKPDPNNPFSQFNEQIQAQQKFMEKEVSGFKAISIAVIAIALLYSLGLLISAIGLFMGENWGRWLCVLACVMMILAGIANAGWRVAVVLPAAKKFNDQQAAAGKPAASGGMFAASGGGSVAIDLVWAVGYPILAIALLMVGPSATYFANKGGSDDAERDSWDGPDDDRRRDDYDDYDDRRRRDDYDR